MNVDTFQLERYFGEQPASEQDVAQLEQALGQALPDDFKRFLVRCNGGSPDSDAFDIDEERGETLLQTLYGINANDTDLDLYTQWRRHVEGAYGKEVPPYLLPIGFDAGGNHVYLSLRPDDYGHVCFGDNEENGHDPEFPAMERLYVVAPSFDGFLAKLRKSDEA